MYIYTHVLCALRFDVMIDIISQTANSQLDYNYVTRKQTWETFVVVAAHTSSCAILLFRSISIKNDCMYVHVLQFYWICGYLSTLRKLKQMNALIYISLWELGYNDAFIFVSASACE